MSDLFSILNSAFSAINFFKPNNTRLIERQLNDIDEINRKIVSMSNIIVKIDNDKQKQLEYWLSKGKETKNTEAKRNYAGICNILTREFDQQQKINQNLIDKLNTEKSEKMKIIEILSEKQITKV